MNKSGNDYDFDAMRKVIEYLVEFLKNEENNLSMIIDTNEIFKYKEMGNDFQRNEQMQEKR
jgi:hypothetical protein